MKKQFLLASLLVAGWRADAQSPTKSPIKSPIKSRVVVPPAARKILAPEIASPSLAAPPLGLAIIDSTGAVQSVCPLQRTEVSADLSGTVARVSVTQRFSNAATVPIEVLYTFPLPHQAAVDAMSFRIGARHIVGQIKKREEAAQIYQEARLAGRNAALLDQERPNIFSQRVANILPGQQISVEISFVQPISYRAGSYEWEFPTVVGPRFVPSGGYQKPGERGAPSNDNDSRVADAEKITPPIALPNQRAGHDLTLQIQLQSALALGEISSALHPITIQRSGEKSALISLQEGAVLPNKDFVLRFKPRDGALQSGVLTHAQGDGGFFQLVLQPPAAPAPSEIAPKEMVFVIDQTGSQSGLPIQKAKETMRFCIRNLNPNDTFQLLGFTTRVNPCFAKPVAATPENLAVANRFLDEISAGGGTDILKAAAYALQIPTDASKARIICFMTDGYVGNDAQILEFVRQNRGAARMFPFGVGNSVNRSLIDGMAREGRGVAEYALLNEDGEKLARRFYERVANPVLLDVGVDWKGLPVADVFPKIIPDLFESGPVVLTGRFTRASNGELQLRGIAGGKPWTQNVRVDFGAPSPSGGAGLPSLWARAKIEDLSNRNVSNAPSSAPSGETANDLKTEITAVALEFRLMSQFTSFVAVEPKIVNIGGVQKTVDVPVEMPDGVSYNGIFGESRGGRGQMPMLGNMSLIGSLFRSGLNVQAGAGGGGSIGGIGGMVTSAGRVTALENRVSPAPRPQITPQQLAAMQPAERIAAIRESKMTPQLVQLIARFAKENQGGNLKVAALPEVVAGRVTIQIWLDPKTDEATKTAFAAQLKALGWQEAAVLRADKLVMGTIEVARLDELAALEGVRWVDVPNFQ